MGDLFRIDVVYSTQQWIMPRIIITLLIILGVIILILEARKRVKAGGKVFEAPKRFFAENYDKVKFWGSIILMIAYFLLLDVIGFTVCSIIFLFLFNSLFAGKERLFNGKYLLNSFLISFVSTTIISILFGTVFDITLPSGFATIWIKAWGITIF